MHPKVYVIIPCYNESEVIRKTIQPLLDKGYRVVVVDDGSATDPVIYIRDLDIDYLRHDINLGQGAALQTGHEFVSRFNPDFVVHFDADGQHNPDDIALFIDELEKTQADVALGSRFINRETTSLVPLKKRIILGIGRYVNWFFTGLFLTDAHNGFRVIRGSVLKKLRLTENRMAHATEILTLIRRNRLHYIECPSRISYTEYSIQKGQKPINSITILIDIIFNKFS